ncbi:hypothetical protein FA13DRAFT_1728917 [Coprinellus micaceus]|uniref:Uncharacterized protein n=1 Tax=Coprinellus micaceus TaxID=71717 RepID=A0A4Y7TMH9_COPMI|nr:hypothetical protein FA13DRAFT_1728917 [Coprinellus micaceus]
MTPLYGRGKALRRSLFVPASRIHPCTKVVFRLRRTTYSEPKPRILRMGGSRAQASGSPLR